MKRITIAALLAAALFNVDDANAAGAAWNLQCGKHAVLFEKNDAHNKITVNGYEFPISGGTRRFFNKAGQLVTVQFAGTDVDHQVAIVITEPYGYALAGWSDTVIPCIVRNYTSW